MLPRLAITTFAILTCAWSATAQTFVDGSRVELLRAVPELSALEFDTNKSTLDPLLRATGAQAESMFAKFVNVTMTEDVHEMRYDNPQLEWKEHRDRFRYVVATRPFSESRTSVQGTNATQPNAKSAYLIAGPFEEMLGDLLPQNQGQSRFRFLGRIAEGGRPSLVVAFLARDRSREGLVWVDDATKRVVRFRMDVLNHPNGGKFKSFSRDVRFTPVVFSTARTSVWLPSSAAVHAQFATGELHSVHRFSEYQTEKGNEIGKADAPAAAEEDGYEVLLKGVEALEQGKPADAVAVLREAVTQLSGRIEPGFYLGLALYKMGDLANAEIQFRGTLKQAPKFVAAHDCLGAVLLARGNQPGAVAEFQDALRLEPGNSKIRANLEAATRTLGSTGTASEVPPAPATGDVTIKVDVRQVLVPVVVTDKQGHHVTALTQSDFKVFEDGREQKITAFTSEREEVSTIGTRTRPKPDAEPGPSDSEAAGPPKALLVRHTYVICLDMMHTDFANSVHVQQALEKLFRQEQAGDSRYVVLALGKDLDVIQDATSDPAKVLAAFDGPNFRHLYMRGQKIVSKFEIDDYEEDLKGKGGRCNPYDGSCAQIAESLVPRAEELAKRERRRTTEFLEQFRFVVEQLARDVGRRTMVLVSDGLLLTPGKIPFGLLEAYFPGYHSTRSLESLHYLIEPIFKQAVRANVAIYTIDSRGLYTGPGYDASGTYNTSVMTQVNREWSDIATDQGLTLSEIAAATGGTAFKNSNDLFAGFERAFADGREYYTLAYVSTNQAQDGKFRKIEVKVRDSKASVIAKRGYWAALP